MPPPAELRNRPQDGISWIQKVAAVELGFWLRLIVWGYVGIYRRKEYVGGATGGPRGWRARPGGKRPPPSWAPHGSTDLPLLSIYTHIPQKHPGAPRNPISTAATFCTREIPSWGLFRHSAGGGVDHGGLLHQHHSLSDDV